MAGKSTKYRVFPLTYDPLEHGHDQLSDIKLHSFIKIAHIKLLIYKLFIRHSITGTFTQMQFVIFSEFIVSWHVSGTTLYVFKVVSGCQIQ